MNVKLLKYQFYTLDHQIFFAEFAASEPVKGLQQDELLAYFAKLRELLDLFISWDWPTYFHDYAQDISRYKNVRPEIAIILLEK